MVKMWDPMAEFTQKTLKNGLNIYASQWPNRSWENIFVIVHAGALQDLPGKNGTAHLLEHLIGYGGDRNGQEENKSFFKNQGGKISFFTNPFATYIPIFSSSEKNLLAWGLERVGKFIFSFPANEQLVEKERAIVQREFFGRYPVRFALDNDVREKKQFFSKTPLENLIQPITGTPETIRNISSSDLEIFHDRYYVPANISILAVGGMAQEEIFEILENSVFSSNLQGERVSLPALLETLPPLTENRFCFNLSDRLESSAKIDLGRFRISASVPGTPPRKAMNIFNGLVGKIIDQEIREKNHWSYGANTSLNDYQALHLISLTFSDLPQDKLEKAEKATLSALSSLPRAEDLFEEIKDSKIKQLKLSDCSGRGVADEAAMDLIHKHSITTIAQEIKDLEAVSFEDIRKIIGHLGPARRWTLVQKP